MATVTCDSCGIQFERNARGRKPKVMLCPDCKGKQTASAATKKPPTVLTCVVCNTKFEYRKRGRRPAAPVCEDCAKKRSAVEAAAKKERKASRVKKAEEASGNRYRFYQFVGPSLEDVPPQPGEKLYFVPRNIFPKSKGIHLYGREVVFDHLEDRNGVKVAHVTVKRRVSALSGNSSNWRTIEEKSWTRLENLTRFKKISVSSEEALERLLEQAEVAA